MPVTTTLLSSVELPTIKPKTRYDVLIAVGKILVITNEKVIASPMVIDNIIDCSNYIGLPGFVDPHIHILGGGGGAGFKSYVNGPSAQDLLQAGITSVVGSLGFDSTTRSLLELIRKARTLSEYGIGVRCLAGGFYFPPLTVTNDLREDYVLIPEIVGAGELALGDSRASSLSDDELANYAGMCFTGASLAGKPAILQVHLGEDPQVFDRLVRVAEKAKLPLSMFHVTHVNRHEELLEASALFGRKGGMLDVTTHLPKQIPATDAVYKLLELGVPDDRITVSTDGFGGMKLQGEQGYKYVPSPVDGLMECALGLLEKGIPMKRVVKFVAENAARYFGFIDRGKLEAGASADILLFDKNTMQLNTVLIAGQKGI